MEYMTLAEFIHNVSRLSKIYICFVGINGESFGVQHFIYISIYLYFKI